MVSGSCVESCPPLLVTVTVTEPVPPAVSADACRLETPSAAGAIDVVVVGVTDVVSADVDVVAVVGVVADEGEVGAAEDELGGGDTLVVTWPVDGADVGVVVAASSVPPAPNPPPTSPSPVPPPPPSPPSPPPPLVGTPVVGSVGPGLPPGAAEPD